MRRQKGNVIVFVLLSMIFLLTVAGVAVDVGALFVARSELHRATDAAALAGAGKLGFDDTVFPTARDYAVSFGASNPTHFGPVALSRNDANAANGDVVLGIWNSGSFTPSTDGSQVNAVLCRTTRTIPIWFGQLVGIPSVAIGAESVAIANPPNTLPPPACVFPIGVTTCQFQLAGAFTSQGCGTAVTFITSSGKTPGTQAGTNTAAWVNFPPLGTGAADLRTALANAANGSCSANPVAGEDVPATNGMDQPVMDDMEGYFVPKYNASEPTTIKDANGNIIYSGKGWEVYVPLIQTDCPPKAVNGEVPIQTFSKFVITQVINHGDCAVNNPNDPNSYPLCPPPYGTAEKEPSLRGIFGYFDCAKLTATPTPIPVPRAALADRLRLVR